MIPTAAFCIASQNEIAGVQGRDRGADGQFPGVSQATLRSGGRSLRADDVAGELLLMSQNGDAWRFEADDNAQWRRVPDAADPLIMLRQ
ncbi:MAG: peptidase [Bradyrhizobium sp.]|nr:peptidase [Bradyrhizobium sp.]